VSALVDKDYELPALITTKPDESDSRHIRWDFLSPVPELPKVEVFFHLAWDRSDNAASAHGNLRIIKAIARKSPGTRQILISSVSAFRDTQTDYGRWKYWLENQFREVLPRGSIVRPGLVIGNGGLSATVNRLARLIPFRLAVQPPLPVATVSLQHFLSETLDMLTSEESREVNLVDNYPASLTDLQGMFKKSFFFEVRIRKERLEKVISRLSRLPLLPAVRRDSLAGLVANQRSPYLKPGGKQ